jgi:hypothetical protein
VKPSRIKKTLLKIASECLADGPESSREEVVLQKAVNQLEMKAALRAQQEVLRHWRELFSEGHFRSGFDAAHPNAPYFHRVARDPWPPRRTFFLAFLVVLIVDALLVATSFLLSERNDWQRILPLAFVCLNAPGIPIVAALVWIIDNTGGSSAWFLQNRLLSGSCLAITSAAIYGFISVVLFELSKRERGWMFSKPVANR